jgi:hypothetical protein
MVIFYIILGQIATLFLSTNYVTTLSFNSPVESVLSGANDSDLFTYISKDRKTVTLKPLKIGIETNLTILGSGGKNYSFFLSGDQIAPHTFVRIEEGEKDSALKKVLTTEKFEVYEGEKYIFVINKTAQEIVINKKKIASKEYFSKGIPLIYEGKRIWN